MKTNLFSYCLIVCILAIATAPVVAQEKSAPVKQEAAKTEDKKEDESKDKEDDKKSSSEVLAIVGGDIHTVTGSMPFEARSPRNSSPSVNSYESNPFISG